METFVDIIGYEGLYQISNFGKVRSLDRKVNHPWVKVAIKKGKMMKTGIKNGYAVILLQKNGIEKHYLIHRLVALHFIPNPENKPEVNHKNGNKLDNRATELEWATRKENHQHALNTGLNYFRLKGLRGTESPNAKLNDEIVRDIRLKFSSGKETVMNLAKKYGIDRSTIYYIIKRRIWKHLD
jgi:hypothetical protein